MSLYEWSLLAGYGAPAHLTKMEPDDPAAGGDAAFAAEGTEKPAAVNPTTNDTETLVPSKPRALTTAVAATQHPGYPFVLSPPQLGQRVGLYLGPITCGPA
ncbi:MAG: hypothetical protein ACREN7_00585 [Candidatus Dormibacteria bacterium]